MYNVCSADLPPSLIDRSAEVVPDVQRTRAAVGARAAVRAVPAAAARAAARRAARQAAATSHAAGVPPAAARTSLVLNHCPTDSTESSMSDK